MGKKKKSSSGPTRGARTVPQGAATLREENTGTKSVDASAMLRMEHLQRLAAWAGVEAGVAPLGALLGRRLAASAEAQGVPLDPSTFVCHRCESILQPGFNCTVRVEKIAKKAKRRKKSHIPSQNNVVYKCHFCSHPNIMRGTKRGYMKSLLASKPRLETDSNVECSSTNTMKDSDRGLEDKETLAQKSRRDISLVAEPVPDLKRKGPDVDAAAGEVSAEKTPVPLLERFASSSRKRRKKNASSTKDAADAGISCIPSNTAEVSGGSSRRKRKGWSSLKEIAENNESKGSISISNFAIPFLLPAAK